MLADLKTQLRLAIEKSFSEIFPSLPGQYPSIVFEIPADKRHGELSSNIAMRLTKLVKKDPLSIAGELVPAIKRNISSGALSGYVRDIEIKKPGFMNFFLTDKAFCEILEDVLKSGKDFGKSAEGRGQNVQIEFVSANPTGPLSVAHARQAAVGDALANIFTFAGFSVKKEFYVNDEGNQINILGRSIELRARDIFGQKIDFPEECYQGDYIRGMAQKFINQHRIKNVEGLNQQKLEAFRQFGVDYLLAVIKQELKDFGVEFDIWSHQSKIATEKNTEKVLELLKDKGFVYTQDGAQWFKSTAFGDDKDRVVRKSDGSFTYLAPDIVYHKDKFERGFQKVFNIWGPDHHGYIPRIKAAAAALGYNPENLEVLIVQLATIFRDGKPLSMSTRRGQYISLREVIDEVGVDAARFFFLMRHISAHLDFDLELAKKETPENPVYYIQYAHARIYSIFDMAKQNKLSVKASGFSRLKEEEEIDLIKKIANFSDIILVCVAQRDPFALVNYLQELATCFHKFYDKHRVIIEDQALAGERLGLIDAARIALSNGLGLLGIKAPVKM